MPSSLNGTGVTFDDGTTQSTAATAGNYIMRTITSTSTWTKPSGLKAVKVTLVGAGGNGGTRANTVYTSAGGNGGNGGGAIEYIPAPSIPGPVSVTVGTAPSKTSSFGAFLSATGGGNGGSSSGSTNGANGTSGIGSGGDINVQGCAAEPATTNPITLTPISAFGLGIAATRPGDGAIPGTNGVGFGAGATGGRAPSPGTFPGGTGTSGVVIVEEFY
jgi:hypothetical protein